MPLALPKSQTYQKSKATNLVEDRSSLYQNRRRRFIKEATKKLQRRKTSCQSKRRSFIYKKRRRKKIIKSSTLSFLLYPVSSKRYNMERNSDSSPHFWSPEHKVPSFSSSTSSSSVTRPWILVLLTSIFLILFTPSLLSSNFRGFRPSFVMYSWDSLNLALVLLAILCGLLSRDGSFEGSKCSDEGKEPLLQSQEWTAYSPAPEQSVYDYSQTTAGIRRMRSSSSYPNLRQDFHAGNDWGIVDNYWRFNDDIQLYRRQPSHNRELSSLDDRDVKLVQADSLELTKSLTTSPPETPSALSSPSILEAVAATVQPPPPPPPPPPVYHEKKWHRKRSGTAAKDIATAIALFYHKNKRRNKAKKIHDDESLHTASQSPPPPPPPPPLPPPPSPSIFSQIFTHRKAGSSKSKRFNTTMSSTQFSPPPPPPPPPTFHHSKKEKFIFPNPSLQHSLPIQPPLPSPPPPLTSPRPPRRKRNKRPTFLQTYPIAPPSPLPPPPPPPPPYSNDKGSYGTPTGEGAASPFCPSPDVNSKAEMFIKCFQAGLKLEKQNSIRQKQRRMEEPQQEGLQEAGIELEMEQEIMKMMMIGFGDVADE